MASILRSFRLGKNKHQKLKEDCSESSENIFEIVSGKDASPKVFNCKYLGSSPIEHPSDYRLTFKTINQIIEMSKARGNKVNNKVALKISSERITMRSRGEVTKHTKKVEKTANKAEVKPNTSASLEDNRSQDSSSLSRSSSNDRVDAHQDDLLLNISIYKISYCSGDLDNKRTVGFIATNVNGMHECHAFITSKPKNAQSIAVAISQAFNEAFENWIEGNKDDQNEEIEKMFMANKENLDSMSKHGKVKNILKASLPVVKENFWHLDNKLSNGNNLPAKEDDYRYVEMPPCPSSKKMNILINFDEPCTKKPPLLLSLDD